MAIFAYELINHGSSFVTYRNSALGYKNFGQGVLCENVGGIFRKPKCNVAVAILLKIKSFNKLSHSAIYYIVVNRSFLDGTDLFLISVWS